MDPHAALELLEYLRTCYPIFLLLLFIVAFVANTMLTASTASQNESPRMGPGGRPLPKRSRTGAFRKTQGFSKTVKRIFNWLSVAVLVTYLADATIYIAHVMVARSEHWWRGQSVVVRLSACSGQICRPNVQSELTIEADLHRRLFFRLRGLTNFSARYHPVSDNRPIRMLVCRHPHRAGYS
jgi:hypothetical protein